MEWKLFSQIIIAFVIFSAIILLFQILISDTNFIVTFVLAIFTIAISIFFFVESNRIFSRMQEKLTLILRGVQNLKIDSEKVERFKSFKGVINPRRLYNEQRNKF